MSPLTVASAGGDLPQEEAAFDVASRAASLAAAVIAAAWAQGQDAAEDLMAWTLTDLGASTFGNIIAEFDRRPATKASLDACVGKVLALSRTMV